MTPHGARRYAKHHIRLLVESGRADAARILSYGRFWSPIDRPADVLRGRRKQCFVNAGDAILVESDAAEEEGRPERWRYCEGWCVTVFDGERPQVFEHAWLGTADRQAVEVTLRTPAIAYFGVALPSPVVRSMTMRLGTWGPFVLDRSTDRLRLEVPLRVLRWPGA